MTNREAIEKLVNARFADEFQGDQELTTAMHMALDALSAEPIKVGRWEQVDGYFGDTYYRCSECKKESYFNNNTPREIGVKYCPYCGTTMQSE